VHTNEVSCTLIHSPAIFVVRRWGGRSRKVLNGSSLLADARRSPPGDQGPPLLLGQPVEGPLLLEAQPTVVGFPRRELREERLERLAFVVDGARVATCVTLLAHLASGFIAIHATAPWWFTWEGHIYLKIALIQKNPTHAVR